MRLFGKPKVSERDAADSFVSSIADWVTRFWPEIRQRSSHVELLREDPPRLGDDAFRSQFALAMLACEMQGLRYLLPPDQADRIWSFVFEIVSEPASADRLGEGAGDALHEYFAAWERDLQEDRLPTTGLAGVLYDRLGFSDGLSLVRLEIMVVAFARGWWKDFLSQHKLVPE